MKLNWPSLRTLEDLAAGRCADARVNGRSAYGGLFRVLWCLRRKGLINENDEITTTGREFLDSRMGRITRQ